MCIFHSFFKLTVFFAIWLVTKLSLHLLFAFFLTVRIVIDVAKLLLHCPSYVILPTHIASSVLISHLLNILLIFKCKIWVTLEPFHHAIFILFLLRLRFEYLHSTLSRLRFTWRLSFLFTPRRLSRGIFAIDLLFLTSKLAPEFRVFCKLVYDLDYHFYALNECFRSVGYYNVWSLVFNATLDTFDLLEKVNFDVTSFVFLNLSFVKDLVQNFGFLLDVVPPDWLIQGSNSLVASTFMILVRNRQEFTYE
jgi:hypothetical protein